MSRPINVRPAKVWFDKNELEVLQFLFEQEQEHSLTSPLNLWFNKTHVIAQQKGYFGEFGGKYVPET